MTHKNILSYQPDENKNWKNIPALIKQVDENGQSLSGLLDQQKNEEFVNFLGNHYDEKNNIFKFDKFVSKYNIQDIKKTILRIIIKIT